MNAYTSKQLELKSNQQLLAILIGQNNAEKLLRQYSSLGALARATEEEFKTVASITNCKAQRLRSAFLLAARLSTELLPESPVLDNPDTVANMLRENCRTYTVEHFQILLLNTRRKLIRLEDISQGTLDTLLVHPREVFRSAILANASAVVLAHNHPSGDPTPSDADIRVTRDLISAGKLLKIDVLDHVIMGAKTAGRKRDYASLRELGHFYV